MTIMSQYEECIEGAISAMLAHAVLSMEHVKEDTAELITMQAGYWENMKFVLSHIVNKIQPPLNQL